MQSYLENKIAVCERTVENWKVAHKKAMQAFECEVLCEDMCSYYPQIDRQEGDIALTKLPAPKSKAKERPVLVLEVCGHGRVDALVLARARRIILNR
jgi:hypothetical protein